MSAEQREAPARVEGEVLGFRQWRVDDDLRLTSATRRGRWEPGVNDARCFPFELDLGLAEEHAAPHPDCECGLYALHAPTFWYGQDAPDDGSIASAMRRLANAVNASAHREYVAGLVVAWGRLEVHREGFRAEHARVAAIAVPESRKVGVIARAVAQEYGVPAVPQAELERVAPEFGVPVPENLRPAPDGRRTAQFFFSSTAAAEDSIRKMITGEPRAHFAPGRVAGSVMPARYWMSEPSPKDAKPAASAAPAPVARARAARPNYDPLAFVPKRKGGRL